MERVAETGGALLHIRPGARAAEDEDLGAGSVVGPGTDDAGGDTPARRATVSGSRPSLGFQYGSA
jgi:hypothetical protein